MSRLYISGPITGVRNYKDIFRRAKIRLVSEGYEVVNPAEMTEVVGEGFTYDEIMQIDLSLLQLCDAVVQLPGWERSRGANIEYDYALGADKIVLDYGELVKS